jgi:putative transposase
MADDLFRNKYRIPSARAAWWDYGDCGAYFVTICTKNKTHFFGEITHAQFSATPIGQLASTLWQEIPQRFAYARLGAFVVMPNHVHGIIIIEKSLPVETRLIASEGREEIIEIDPPIKISPTTSDTQPQKRGGVTGKKNPMLLENLSRILRWYTGRISFEAHKFRPDFGWQPRFHDHIIRTDSSYQAISEYIVTNPAKWSEDTFFSE